MGGHLSFLFGSRSEALDNAKHQNVASTNSLAAVELISDGLTQEHEKPQLSSLTPKLQLWVKRFYANSLNSEFISNALSRSLMEDVSDSSFSSCVYEMYAYHPPMTRDGQLVDKDDPTMFVDFSMMLIEKTQRGTYYLGIQDITIKAPPSVMAAHPLRNPCCGWSKLGFNGMKYSEGEYDKALVNTARTLFLRNKGNNYSRLMKDTFDKYKNENKAEAA